MLLSALRRRCWTAAAATALLLVGCDKGPDRSTPEGTIAAARWAVERGGGYPIV